MGRAQPSGRSVPSVQELIRRRRRQGFVGRDAERAAFRANFDLPIEDERHRCVFHVHGTAGVGKTFLVREWEQLAREREALTAYVDEAAGSVPEALAAICAQLARQGRRFKELERLLATHRERVHEAELAAVTAAAPTDPGAAGEPSAGSVAVSRAALAVAGGLVPGAGAFTGAVDPTQIARGADQLRAGLTARFRNQEDAQLVLHPERVLTPVLLEELERAAAEVPWLVLFFDTYERTGPFLDAWLHEVMAGDRHGPVPGNVVVVTAGQQPLDTARWSDLAWLVADVPLAPFTEAESRGLLAGKGVLAEPVVAEVLRLTGGLPVLVSTLAEARPADPDDVGDPSATAVDRFLKWERDPVRQDVALACALPRRLDAEVFRAAVACAEDEADELFAWLRGLPFVSDRGDRVLYHDVVRTPMVRLQRLRSPRRWAERQRRLAEAFGAWRGEAEGESATAARRGATGADTDARTAPDAGAAAYAVTGARTAPDAGTSADAGTHTRTGPELPPDPRELWAEDRWRELRLAESYHALCADGRAALPEVLRDFVDACDLGDATALRWARALADAGRDGGAEPVARWGHDLLAALAEGGVVPALGLLLNRAGFDDTAQALARVVRGNTLRGAGAYEGALGEYDRALALDTAPGESPSTRDRTGLTRHTLVRAHRGRALTRADLGDYETAVADLDRALELAPAHARNLATRGEYHRILRDHDRALDDLDKAIRLDPAREFAWASRGATRLALGDAVGALTDLDHALELQRDYGWALVRRARAQRALGQPARQLADLHHAVALQPDSAWFRCERGDALRAAGRHAEALDDYDRAIGLDEAYASAYASRAASRSELGRHDEALADLDRALALRPQYVWALRRRAQVHLQLGLNERALADVEQARELGDGDVWAQEIRARVAEAARTRHE
ncbi:hypothetical protein SGFS_053690 [Streptomyces graminofaciens]|uniref:Uncharacterized protein n=1 Tax=Streptomyces graminofaciens TaxID=68212 RepID=A0ABN5VKU1_9ACTN|nr:tetratricopeptide repeat protein [Streptomyces graminofaciens]BBC34075.1 hypothetical protein SGFS_053690 [Streptomyces graminofaciens]